MSREIIKKCSEWDMDKRECKRGHPVCGSYTDCHFADVIIYELVAKKDISTIVLKLSEIYFDVEIGDISCGRAEEHCIDILATLLDKSEAEVLELLEGDSNE